MKTYTLILLAFLLTCGYSSNGQPLRDISFYANNPEVSASARTFYNEDQKPSNNAVCYSIIDSMCAKNERTRPFYIYLVCGMLGNGDATMNDILAKACLRLTESNPDALIQFFACDNKLVTTDFFFNWANIMAYDFRVHCEATSERCLRVSQRNARLACKARSLKALNFLYTEAGIKGQEQLALAAVMDIPEVYTDRGRIKTMAEWEQSFSAGIYRRPIESCNYFWVKIWKNTVAEVVTHFDFLVDPCTWQVLFFDPANDRAMDMTTWRAKWQ